MFYLLVNNIFFFIQKVKSKRKKGKKESKSLTVRGKTILGRTSGNPGFGVTGFQVTDNPDKPKHIFDNVLMSHRPPHGASTGVATCTGEGTRASSLAFSFNVSTESTEVVMTVKRLPMAWKL